ncbi:hypothetical protein HK102_003512, partial [Quaeritorhiza haematococci]
MIKMDSHSKSETFLRLAILTLFTLTLLALLPAITATPIHPKSSYNINPSTSPALAIAINSGGIDIGDHEREFIGVPTLLRRGDDDDDEVGTNTRIPSSSSSSSTSGTSTAGTGESGGSGRLGNPNYIHIHGLLMFFAWGYFLPLGILSARHFKSTSNPNNPWWFRIHTTFLALTIILSVVSYVLLKLKTPSTDGSAVDDEHDDDLTSNVHRVIGHFVIWGSVGQTVLGLVIDRLFTLHPTRTKTPWWDKLHWWFGRLLGISAIASLFLGAYTYHLNTLVLLFLAIHFAILAVLFISFEVLIGKKTTRHAHVESRYHYAYGHGAHPGRDSSARSSWSGTYGKGDAGGMVTYHLPDMSMIVAPPPPPTLTPTPPATVTVSASVGSTPVPSIKTTTTAATVGCGDGIAGVVLRRESLESLRTDSEPKGTELESASEEVDDDEGPGTST